MMTPAPNEFPRELLAAYVDGELDADARVRVERWLVDHPEVRDELSTQRLLSPTNASLWDRAEPAEPSEARWADCRRGIEAQLSVPASPRYWRAGIWALAGLATAGVAAAIAWVAFAPAPRPFVPEKAPAPELARTEPLAPPPREAAASATEDPLAGMTVLAVAGEDDVVLDRVPEFPAGWLPVGRHPLQDILLLATEEELLVAEVVPGAAWPSGSPRMTTAPGDAPMIFAPRLR